MTKNNAMILSILNNFFGYPFNYTKYYSVNMREGHAKTLMDNLNHLEYKISEYENNQIIEMYKILEKEIEDWEWEAVMQESKIEYNNFINNL